MAMETVDMNHQSNNVNRKIADIMLGVIDKNPRILKFDPKIRENIDDGYRPYMLIATATACNEELNNILEEVKGTSLETIITYSVNRLKIVSDAIMAYYPTRSELMVIQTTVENMFSKETWTALDIIGYCMPSSDLIRARNILAMLALINEIEVIRETIDSVNSK